eukprot:gene9429-19584_t
MKVFAFLTCLILNTVAFRGPPRHAMKRPTLQMGLFDSIFGPKKSASASHILVKGPNSATFLTKLKGDLNKAKNVPIAFADAAAQYSACPSAQKGGALGKFNQGQMVPAFDKVVFNEEIGVIHGPISTPFGSHLILIDERSG